MIAVCVSASASVSSSPEQPCSTVCVRKGVLLAGICVTPECLYIWLASAERNGTNRDDAWTSPRVFYHPAMGDLSVPTGAAAAPERFTVGSDCESESVICHALTAPPPPARATLFTCEHRAA